MKELRMIKLAEAKKIKNAFTGMVDFLEEYINVVNYTYRTNSLYEINFNFQTQHFLLKVVNNEFFYVKDGSIEDKSNKLDYVLESLNDFQCSVAANCRTLDKLKK